MLYTHIPDISCFYTDITDDTLSQAAAHYGYELILITGGRARALIQQKTYSLSPGSLIFISRLERHNFIIEEEPYCRYVITASSKLVLSYLKDPELASVFVQRQKDFSHVIQLSEQAYGKLLPFFRQLAQEYTEQAAFYISKSLALFSSLLIELYRTAPDFFPMHGHSTMSDAVLNAQRYINEHYDRSLTLQEIADSLFVNRHSLSIAFKEIVGTTFKEYLILFRIAEAKKLLITTDLPVTEISMQVGYVNVNNFVKVFREREGITPLQYRKQFAKPFCSDLS